MAESSMKRHGTSLAQRVYLGLAIAVVMAGLIYGRRWVPSIPWIRWGLPALSVGAFLLAFWLHRRGQTVLAHVCAMPVGALALLLWGASVVLYLVFLSGFREITDVSKYESILQERREHRPDLVGHFPREIPREALDVRISFRPRFMPEGGTHIQLRYSLPDGMIDDLYERFSRMTTKSFRGGSSSDYINQEGGMATAPFHTSGSENREFPADYEIMVFDQPPPEGVRPDWNHGECHGVAISKERNEIVYWAEYW